MKRKNDYEELLGEQEYFVTPHIRASIHHALAAMEPVPAGATVLDVGAGECPLRDSLEAKGYRYQSLDIEQNTAESIDYLVPIDRPLPEALRDAGCFDLLILTEVLEHVADWATAFDNISRLLKPGGTCIVTVPFFYMLHEEPHDFWRPTDHALRFFAQSQGLRVLETKRNGDGWDVLGTLLCSTSVCRRSKSVLAYLFVVPVWLTHKMLKWFFKSRCLQGVVEFQMRYYTGNYFLLRK